MKTVTNNISLVLGLIRVFAANPLSSTRNLRIHNIRRLRAAISRHDHVTVLTVARNALTLPSIEIPPTPVSAEPQAPGVRKARELEARYPGITDPVGIRTLPLLEEKLAQPPHRIDTEAPVRVNVLLPQLDPLIMFGGYIACLHFIRRVQAHGHSVRILLCESGAFERVAVETKLASNPQLQAAIKNAEVENITQNQVVTISPSDAFVCYSYWTGIKAHHLASAVGKKFVFFLQEYEAIFHSYDSCHALASYVYNLPHRAIFNTSLLADYFRKHQLGVFAQEPETGVVQQVAFQHALTPTTPPTLENLRQRKVRKFLIYGRPEGHARRNLFEIALMGLKLAIQDGVFDSNWEFVGVGTLGNEYSIDLGGEHTLELRGTLAQTDFGAALSGYDLGLSLMLAPHPSILPFEMASAGQLVVTNTYDTRTEEVLRSISSNIEPCKADPYAVAEAISRAVNRIDNHEDRLAGSSLDWVNNWDESFNDALMTEITSMLTQ